jgi:predicted HTH transcriptional regulator
MYSNQDLIDIIDVFRTENDTETEWLEFKSNYLSNEEIGKYISALSNGAVLRGKPFAYLIFGVDDKTHEVIGTSFDYRKAKQGNEDLENWLKHLVEPKLGFTFYEVKYSALKKLVVLEIPAAYIRPTAFSGKEYIREGSHLKGLFNHPEIEQQLWFALNQVSYEQATSPVQDLHFKMLAILANSRGIDFSEEKFTTLRMLDANGKFNNLARLLSDENHLIVKFAVYKDSHMDFRVKKEFSGSWIAMLDQVLEYVNIYNDTSARVIGNSATRTEIQSYPDPSLREIVVNAFSHLDLTFPSDIKIEFYPDRVEIASPGSLYRTSMREVFSGRQSFRNPNLVYVLNQFHYIENYATGLKKTTAAYEEYGKKPVFESTENFFTVILPNVNIGVSKSAADKDSDEVVGKVTGKVTGKVASKVAGKVACKITDTQKKVLDSIAKNPNITIAEMVRSLQLSDSGIRKIISKLKALNYIERVGSDKTGYWKVIKK